MKVPVLISILSLSLSLQAQERNITIKAHIVGEDNKPMSNVMVINKRAACGFIAEIDGSFNTIILKSDTLAVLCRGFNDLRVSFSDSADRDIYQVTIQMTRKLYNAPPVVVDPRPKKNKPQNNTQPGKKDTLKKDTLDYYNSDAYKLKQVTIYGVKKPGEIRKEIDSLGVENTDMYKHYNSLESPITALYERFSKREQDKRKVAELENEDRKKEVLRDLLALYISYDIIELTDEEFDEFLNGLYMPDEVLKNYSDYMLGEFVKKQYIAFRSYKKSHQDYNEALKKFNGNH